jgi:protease-4
MILRREGCVIALAMCTISACDGRPKLDASPAASRPHSGPALAILDLSGGLPEQEATSLLSVSSRRGSFDELVHTVDAVAKDKNTKGVFVRFGGGSLGMARAEEAGELLSLLKKTKPVYCHADGLSNATLDTALRGCTKVTLSPAGEVEAVGIAAQIVYMHKLLAEQLHVTLDILQVGKFKGAEEPLTRDGPSDEARASLDGVLVSMRSSWLEDIRAGRGQKAVDAAEDGPYSPERALALGLIDDIGYLDDARDNARKASGAVREQTRFGRGADETRPDDLGELIRMLAGEGGSGAPIALVRATGSISMGGGGGILGGSGGISEREMDRVLARLEKDDDVRAVVLRIDSPGGSALASDLIWHRLMKIRAKKPLVVSVGEMAASGGYYIGCTANVIFAEPGSIVGSIGVVGGKVGIGRALEQIGVHAETFPANKQPLAGARAAYLSPLAEWDDATRKRVLESMTGIYDLFLARVAEGRKTTVDKIAPYAEGRIFSGLQGKQNGLVDEIGGLGAAIARARELAKLAADAEVEAVGTQRNVLESLASGGEDESESRAAFGFRRASSLVEELAHFAPQVAPFVASLVPIVDGERTLTTLPFALFVH